MRNYALTLVCLGAALFGFNLARVLEVLVPNYMASLHEATPGYVVGLTVFSLVGLFASLAYLRETSSHTDQGTFENQPPTKGGTP